MLSPKPMRRTWSEIAWMTLLAGVALLAVAAITRGMEGRAPAEKPVTNTVSSPLDGIFYASEKPGEPPSVSVGTAVIPTTVIGFIEPMNATTMPLIAGTSGTVTEIMVQDGEMVEKGTILIKIQPPAEPTPVPGPRPDPVE